MKIARYEHEINLRQSSEYLAVPCTGATSVLLTADRTAGTWATATASLTVKIRARLSTGFYTAESDFPAGPLSIPFGGGQLRLGSTQLEGVDELVVRLAGVETGGTDNRHALLGAVVHSQD